MNRQQVINTLDKAIRDVKRLGNWFLRWCRKEATQAARRQLNTVINRCRQEVMCAYFTYYRNLPADANIKGDKIWDVFVEAQQMQPVIDKIKEADRLYNRLKWYR